MNIFVIVYLLLAGMLSFAIGFFYASIVFYQALTSETLKQVRGALKLLREGE